MHPGRRCGSGLRSGERNHAGQDGQSRFHRIRSLSPMKRVVDDAFGFSRWIVATETPLLAEMTPNVSPACTVQNCFSEAVVVFVRLVVGVVVDIVRTGGAGIVAVVPAEGDLPAFMPARISTIAIVAASKNAAGPT
jgi:hypothetical protein